MSTFWFRSALMKHASGFKCKQILWIRLITVVLLTSVHAEKQKCFSMFSPFPTCMFPLLWLSRLLHKTPLEVHCPPFLWALKTAGHICGSAYCFQMKTLLNCRMCFPPPALDNSWCVTWINQWVPERSEDDNSTSMSGLALNSQQDLA